MKHLQLFETYKSQKELEKLANDVIRACAEKTYNDIAIFLKFMSKQDDRQNDFFKNNNQPYIERPIGKLQPISLEETFHKTIDAYPTLGDFITYSGTYISFRLDKYSNLKGSFNNSYYGRSIEIFHTEYLLDELNNMYERNGIESSQDIYSTIYSKSIHEVLVHELQHSYDDWISGGKALLMSDEYKKSHSKKIGLDKKSKHSELSVEEKEFIDKQFKDYLNLKHEIDARFTHTIYSHSPIVMDFYKVKSKDLKYRLEDCGKYYRDFKIYFDGWDNLSEKDRYRIQRRLSQFYEFEKDEVKRKNKELQKTK